MNTKRVYQSLLMAAMVVVIGMGMVSCVDNIDNSVTPSDKEQQEQAEEAQQEKAQKFWAVVSQLVDVDDYTDDYEDKTFEPTYGVEGAEDGTRYVFTNDMATAAARFADLVEQEGIDETTEQYTYDDPDVGTLVYTKGTGRNLATVGVRVKQIPNLKKIVYVPGAYANGSFRGRAYYRFGDVVKRPVQDYDGNNVDEYWICVRPAFGPESKGDSHWVCLNVLPKKNVWHYYSDNSVLHYYLPTGIGKNEEHMQNLAEMLYAIYFPTEWQTNVSNAANKGLKMFHDFDKTKYTYHSKYFWMDVHKQWKKKEILKKALNYSAEESDFKDMLSDDGIRLLHSGYSWWTKTSWNATLYEAHYQNGTVPKEMNMHKVSLDKPTHHMEEDAIDCRKMGRVYYDYYEAFFNNDGNYRWTIRHATGKELAAAGTAYDKQGKIQGVEDVYRYYRDVEPTADGAYATTDPEETTADVPANRVKVGHLIGKNGKFYRSYDAAQEDGNGAAAMVVYLGGDKCVEKDKDWNGLAIALEDAKNNDETQFAYKTGGKDDKSCSTTIEDEEHIASRHDGWAMTKRMKEKACGKDHSHPAVEVVGAMEQIPGCSEWFIPATGQWDMAIQAMGFGEYTDNHGYWGYHEEGRWLWEDAGVEGADLKASSSIREENSLYMTTTLWAVGTFEYYVFQNEPLNSVLDYVTKRMSDKSFVRPFLAFKVGNGGSINPEEPEE